MTNFARELSDKIKKQNTPLCDSLLLLLLLLLLLFFSFFSNTTISKHPNYIKKFYFIVLFLLKPKINFL